MIVERKRSGYPIGEEFVRHAKRAVSQLSRPLPHNYHVYQRTGFPMWASFACARRLADDQAGCMTYSSQDWYWQFFELSDAIISGLDGEDLVIYVNRKGAGTLGRTQGGIIGSDWFEGIVRSNRYHKT